MKTFREKHFHFRANLLNVASGEDSHVASTEDVLIRERRVALTNREGRRPAKLCKVNL
jgi:hypothetical protein